MLEAYRKNKDGPTWAWTHVAVSYQRKIGVTFYLNGAKDVTVTNFVGSIYNSAQPLRLGIGGSTVLNPLGGVLDGVWMYKHALTTIEVRELAVLSVDADQDGISNYDEYLAGTNPRVPDGGGGTNKKLLFRLSGHAPEGLA